MRLPTPLKHHWGFTLLCTFSLLALVRLLRQPMPGHYRVFAGAGRALWNSQNPYGTDFGTGVGLYFYSPTCALTVFGPLSLLPEWLGLVVYMTAAWALFTWGARRLWLAFGGDAQLLQWFWAAITAQVVGAILSSKLELAIVGILMGAIAELKMSGPRWSTRKAGAAVALAALLNWKFQPVPVVGLLMLSWVMIRRDLKIPATLAGALTIWYTLPFAFFDSALVHEMHVTWQTTFSKFVSESVLNFDNIFTSIHNTFGLQLTFVQTQAASAGIGVLMAGTVFAWIRKSPLLDGAFLLSIALGSVFMNALSPLGQNNALILYAPLLLTSLICYQRSENRSAWLALLVGCVGVIALAYSDLVPFEARETLRHLSIKSWAIVALGVAIVARPPHPAAQLL